MVVGQVVASSATGKTLVSDDIVESSEGQGDEKLSAQSRSRPTNRVGSRKRHASSSISRTFVSSAGSPTKSKPFLYSKEDDSKTGVDDPLYYGQHSVALQKVNNSSEPGQNTTSGQANPFESIKQFPGDGNERLENPEGPEGMPMNLVLEARRGYDEFMQSLQNRPNPLRIEPQDTDETILAKACWRLNNNLPWYRDWDFVYEHIVQANFHYGYKPLGALARDPSLANLRWLPEKTEWVPKYLYAQWMSNREAEKEELYRRYYPLGYNLYHQPPPPKPGKPTATLIRKGSKHFHVENLQSTTSNTEPQKMLEVATLSSLAPTLFAAAQRLPSLGLNLGAQWLQITASDQAVTTQPAPSANAVAPSSPEHPSPTSQPVVPPFLNAVAIIPSVPSSAATLDFPTPGALSSAAPQPSTQCQASAASLATTSSSHSLTAPTKPRWTIDTDPLQKVTTAKGVKIARNRKWMEKFTPSITLSDLEVWAVRGDKLEEMNARLHFLARRAPVAPPTTTNPTVGSVAGPSAKAGATMGGLSSIASQSAVYKPRSSKAYTDAKKMASRPSSAPPLHPPTAPSRSNSDRADKKTRTSTMVAATATQSYGVLSLAPSASAAPQTMQVGTTPAGLPVASTPPFQPAVTTASPPVVPSVMGIGIPILGGRPPAPAMMAPASSTVATNPSDFTGVVPMHISEIMRRTGRSRPEVLSIMRNSRRCEDRGNDMWALKPVVTRGGALQFVYY